MPQVREWNERYVQGETPWDVGEPNPFLIEFIESSRVSPGRALDVGCGTGTNAIWLAQQGFDVLGVDISDVAIELARAKVDDPDLSIRFETLDFLKDKVPGAPFDFVFDMGCFHVFDDPTDQALFAERVAAVLTEDGFWLSLMGSTEGPYRDHGPPRRSLRDIANAIEPSLQILEVHAIEFSGHLPAPAAAWLVVSRRRRVPAQPSTLREPSA